MKFELNNYVISKPVDLIANDFLSMSWPISRVLNRLGFDALVGRVAAVNRVTAVDGRCLFCEYLLGGRLYEVCTLNSDSEFPYPFLSG